jgi:RNA polymerase sigma factor (sigma-70 family)
MVAGEREISEVRKLKRRRRSASDEKLLAMVRRGDEAAFEALYDHHARELLSFCRYLLGSLHDAEDAVQSTFASAHRSLLADDRAIDLRPWLFAIARNASLSILRRARAPAEAERLPILTSDPFALLEQREDLRQLVGTLLELPERQRTSLILAELHGLRYREISEVLGVRPEQVKAYVFQARANLTAERHARALDCLTIRSQLADARGHGLLKTDIRRHLGSCHACREYAETLASSRGLRVFVPLAGIAGLRHRLVWLIRGRPRVGSDASGWASSMGTPTAELTGGGGLVLAAKLLTGIALLGAGAKLGASALVPPGRASQALASTPRMQADAAVISAAGNGSTRSAAMELPGGARIGTAKRSISSRPSVSTGSGPRLSASGSPAAVPQMLPSVHTPGEKSVEVARLPPREGQGAHGKGKEAGGKPEAPGATAEEAHGKSEEAHGKKGEEAHGKLEEAPAPGKSEEAHGKSEAAPGKSEAAPGKSGESHSGSQAPPDGSSEAGSAAQEAHGKSEEPHGQSQTPAELRSPHAPHAP